MEVKELRIGTIITLDNKKYYPELKDVPMVIAGIKETLGFENELTYSINLNPITIPTNQYYETYSQFVEYIKPIPLTEEWLIKFGFENSEISITDNTKLFVCVRTPKKYRNEGFAIIMQMEALVLSFPCEYVHQLQNIYSALKSQELTLK